LDCRPMATCDGCHDFIWTPFWVFKYLMETLSCLLSYRSRLMPISSPRRPQLLIYYRDLFYPRCCCYRHNLAEPEGGPRARWAQRIIVMGLRIGSCAGGLCDISGT
jgi:hypothetical protein